MFDLLYGSNSNAGTTNNLAVLSSVTVLVGGSDRERKAPFILAIFVDAVGRNTLLVGIELVLCPFSLLNHVNECYVDLTSTADDARRVSRTA